MPDSIQSMKITLRIACWYHFYCPCGLVKVILFPVNEIRDEMVEGDRNDCDFFSLVSFPGFVDFDGFKT